MKLVVFYSWQSDRPAAVNNDFAGIFGKLQRHIPLVIAITAACTLLAGGVSFIMPEKELFTEKSMAALAKRFRKEAGKTRAQAARKMGVSQT